MGVKCGSWVRKARKCRSLDVSKPRGLPHPVRYIVRVRVRVRVGVTLQLTVSQSICLGVEPNLGLLTGDLFF
jgi:hypothetical protein